jgi:membrane protease YdiL (CAAX protease family)
MSGRFDAPALPPHAQLSEAIGIVLVCFGWFIVGSLEAASSWRPGSAAGFNDNSFDGTLASEVILATMAILLLWGRRYPLHTLYPQPSWRGVLDGVIVCVCALLGHNLVVLLLPQYATTPIAEMLASTTVSWSSTIPLMVVNGFYEEVFLLGYLMRGLRRYGASTSLGIALFVRMLYHTYQGPAGVVSVMAVGLVFGLYFQRKGQLFPVVLAHIAIDLRVFLIP